MRTTRFLFLGILLLVSAGCKDKPAHSGESNQGMVTYRITYPDSLSYGLKSALLPKEIVLVFKDGKGAFIASAGMGMMQMVNLLDFNKRTAVSLLIDNLRENVGCRLSPEEITENENSFLYRFEQQAETKRIAGYECRRVSVSDVSGGNHFDVYASEAIRFPYWNSPFTGQDRLMLEYTHTMQNLTMKLEATRVDLNTPVDTTLFEVKGKYRWMNQKEFLKYLSAF